MENAAWMRHQFVAKGWRFLSFISDGIGGGPHSSDQKRAKLRWSLLGYEYASNDPVNVFDPTGLVDSGQLAAAVASDDPAAWEQALDAVAADPFVRDELGLDPGDVTGGGPNADLINELIRRSTAGNGLEDRFEAQRRRRDLGLDLEFEDPFVNAVESTIRDELSISFGNPLIGFGFDEGDEIITFTICPDGTILEGIH